MDNTFNLGRMKSEDFAKIQEIADRFERDWQFLSTGETPPEIAAYVPGEEDPLRIPALHELVKTDMEIRCRRGKPVELEEYLARFADLGTKQTVSTQLIYEEYRVRSMWGDRPGIDSYKARFPEQFAELERLLREQPLPTVPAPQETPAAGPKTPDSATPAASTAASQALSTSGDFLSGYKLVKKIGSGGFGEVWMAEAPGGVPVAVKKIFRPLDHEESQRERDSLELIKRLRHPFLLSTQAFAQGEDRLFIVMELADGSLRDRAKECRKGGLDGIPLAELVTYFREAADALDYLHSEHVLHRDIKPDNILTLKRHSKLADFGLARVLEKQGLVSASGSGTPAYMAPEVWRGKVCEQSDQYSLAFAYAEMRLGKRPFESREMMDLMLDHLERKPNLEGLPEPEKEVLFRALAKKPEERFATCVEFMQTLMQACGPMIGISSPSFIIPTAGGRMQSSPETDIRGGKETAVAAGQPTEMGDRTEVDPFASVPGARPPTGQPGRQQTGWRQGQAPVTAQGQGVNQPGSVFVTLPPVKKRFPVAAAVFVPLVLVLGVAAAVGYKMYGTKPTKEDGNVAVTTGGVKLPENCVRAEGAQIVQYDGTDYYDKIDCLAPDKTPVRFLLIPHRGGNDPPTFYMMETEVWAGLFKQFADTNPTLVKNSEWKKGPKAGEQDLGITNERLPVVNVNVSTAHQFARWLHSRGYLPTIQQWDKAAGFFDKEENRAEGPFKGPWKKDDKIGIALNREVEGPLEVGKATHDISPFGVHDMTGNVQEWTRNLVEQVRVRTILDNPRPEDLVWLRGRWYMEDKPLRFADLEEIRTGKVVADQFESQRFYRGFRVVLEP